MFAEQRGTEEKWSCDLRIKILLHTKKFRYFDPQSMESVVSLCVVLCQRIPQQHATLWQHQHVYSVIL